MVFYMINYDVIMFCAIMQRILQTRFDKTKVHV